jgi:hypothetical protein
MDLEWAWDVLGDPVTDVVLPPQRLVLPFVGFVKTLTQSTATAEMRLVLETARHAVPIADAGSGAVAVGVGMMTTIVAIDPTTTTTGLLRPGIMMMTAPGRVAVVAVVEELIVAVLRDVLMVIEADTVRLIGKGHEVGRSSVRILLAHSLT